jgi:hypothetical protein
VWRRRVEPRLVAPAVPRRVDGQERAACRGDREAWPARCEREARAAPIVEAEQHIVDVRLQLVHLAVDRLEFLVGRDHRCHPCHPWLTCSTAQPLWCAAAWLTRVEARGDRDEAEQQPCSCRRHHGHRVDRDRRIEAISCGKSAAFVGLCPSKRGGKVRACSSNRVCAKCAGELEVERGVRSDQIRSSKTCGVMARGEATDQETGAVRFCAPE